MWIVVSLKLCSDILLDSVHELLALIERRRVVEAERQETILLPAPDATSKDDKAFQKSGSSILAFGGSLISQCTRLKHEYDSCFFDWYQNEYLPSAGSTEVTDPCSEILREYRTCLQAGIVDAGVIDLQSINIDIPEDSLRPT